MTARRLWIPMLVALVGCEDDPPVPSGNLARPSGLAFVERAPGFAGLTPLQRSDLFIADAEAQGVRVAQFTEQLGSDGRLRFAPPFFVPAPVAYFKLAAEAPGFPTRVVAAPSFLSGDREVPTRAYVLAAARGELHVLEMADVPYQAPATVDTHVRVGGIDLLALEPTGVPVDVALVEAETPTGEDQLLVLFDGLGDAPGRLWWLGVSALDPSSVRRIGSAPVPPGAMRVVFRAAERRALVNSTETGAVTEVSLVEGTPLAARALFAGGPTGTLIDAGELGVLALRLDRSAAVWFAPGPGGFERPRLPLPSPYDDEQPREPGVLALRVPLAVVGAHARLEGFGLPDGSTFAGEAPGRDVVLVVHTDARATYIVGPVPSVLAREETVVQAAYPSSFDDAGQPAIDLPEGCDGVPACTPPSPNQENDDRPCRVFGLRPLLQDETLRLTAHGELARGLDPAFEIGAAAAGRWRVQVVDVSRSTFADARVRPGDTARFPLSIPDCAGVAVDALFEGPVTDLGVGEDNRGTVGRPGARLEAEVSVVATEPPTDLEALCPEAVAATAAIVRYEVHVPDEQPEAVLAVVDGQRVLRVLERSPISVERGPGGEETGVIGVGLDPDGDSPLLGSFRGPTGPDAVASLRCERRSVGADAALLGACFGAQDCGAGRPCVGAVGACPGACQATCVGPCFEAEVARVCPSVTFEVLARTPVLDLAQAPLGGTRGFDPRRSEAARALSAPADVVFHPQRRSFFISLPGARTVVEQATSPGVAPVRLR